MGMRDYIEAINSRVVVYDGGMGATLEQFDLTSEDYGGLPGKCHEALVLNRPDVIEGVHESMLEAGAEVVETDTFQASRLKLDEWGLGEHTLEINTKAAQIARKAAGEDRFVAGSIGPTGMLPASNDPTLGNISFGELVTVFTEQARGLVEGGADLLIIETAQDILEVKAAVFGAREAFEETGRTLPIQTSVSLLPQGGKMLLGTDIAAVLTTLSALDVQVIGLNCSTGPEDMRDAIRFLGEYCPLPVHCIPNAGLPLQGPNGETIFPEEPEPLAAALQEFVERYGVSIVGGCCGTTPDHIRAIAERVKGREAGPRPSDAWPPHLSSMIAATPLEQEPRPAMVGERVNSQGSRKAKELLLADDYDGIVQVAEDQVEGGAHVLDVCVALTERQDEADQMREVVKRISLTQPTPIQIDSTEPDVIKAALEQIPGRAIVNSINLEAGRDKADVVVPLARAHGAALIALVIDEVGMAKTADRKVEIAKRIREIACDEHGLDPELLIFDLLTFTLTTGDEEWRPSAVETIEGIRRVKAELPGVKTSLGVSNVSFGVGPPARAVLNSVFLHHAVEAGLDLAMVNPNHITPYGEIPTTSASWPTTWSSTGARTRWSASSSTSSPRARRRPRRSATRPRTWSPRRRSTGASSSARGTASRRTSTASVEKIGAVPTLNDVLLPGDEGGRRQVRRRRADPAVRAPVGRGDEARRRPARAVPRQDRGLHEGHGRARDGVRRRARHRQVARQHDPDQQRLHRGRPRQAGPDRHDRGRGQGARRDGDRAVGAAGLDLEADAAVRGRAARAGPGLPRARRRRRDQPQLRPAHPLPRRPGVGRGLRARRLLLQGRVRGAVRDGPARGRRGARGAGRQGPRRGPDPAREGPRAGGGADRRRLRALGRAHRRAGARAAVLGRARDPGRPRRGVPPPRPARAVQAPLGRPRREGRGVGEAARDEFHRAWRACGASRTTSSRARCWATSRSRPRATS